jgi:hypothetical protein
MQSRAGLGQSASITIAVPVLMGPLDGAILSIFDSDFLSTKKFVYCECCRKLFITDIVVLPVLRTLGTMAVKRVEDDHEQSNGASPILQPNMVILTKLIPSKLMVDPPC